MTPDKERDAKKLQEHLSGIPTEDLIGVLVAREGVRMFTTQPDAKYCIEDETGIYENGDGPVKIITVVEP